MAWSAAWSFKDSEKLRKLKAQADLTLVDQHQSPLVLSTKSTRNGRHLQEGPKSDV